MLGGSEISVAIASEHLWPKSDANKAIELQLFSGNSFPKRDSLTFAIVMLIKDIPDGGLKCPIPTGITLSVLTAKIST
jgi:hypothetical protein